MSAGTAALNRTSPRPPGFEMQRAGVQHLPPRARDGLAAVQHVGQQRMAQAGHVHADLVRAAGFQAADHFAHPAAGIDLAAA